LVLFSHFFPPDFVDTPHFFKFFPFYFVEWLPTASFFHKTFPTPPCAFNSFLK
jgi:hypothetical protein